MYKTEAKTHKVRVFEFNQLTLGTDTLFNGHDDQEAIIRVWEYDASGNGKHKKLAEGEFYLSEIKDKESH